jgi:hypothetical protein
MELCCVNCEFGKDYHKEGVLRCKRFPPTGPGIENDYHDKQPLVKEDDWCGEHKIKTG